ncbi:OB-fold nucleic acid binding domain-containing protein [Anaerofustis sp.]|uniref:3'-5' exoribonuclease YhaM family protein n=1 Tax=Anaerofustis sp. TaxID=1872517 RepID=UPI0025C5510D|nr:OB-fold nucleic acid binding domain-containing protein [Anaerofustis sp.]
MINELKVSDKVFDNFILKSVMLRKTRAGKDYLDIILKDKSGEIPAKLWNVSPEIKDEFEAGCTVKVSGEVDSFGSNPQVKIDSMEKVILNDDEMAKLVESAPMGSDEMFNFVTETISAMENSDIKTITEVLVDKYKDKFKVYPAAKSFHHAMKGGLMYHTYTMLKNAKKLTDTYTFLNKDLVFAGVILHDICKTEEMECNDIGVVESYTTDGQLLGHIIQCICEIDNVSRRLEIKSEVPLLLKHMVLSHHYHPEFGSPKYPMIPEAELLHYLDIVDSRMNQMETAFKGTKENEFSSRVRMLDNRNIYHYTLENKEEE